MLDTSTDMHIHILLVVFKSYYLAVSNFQVIKCQHNFLVFQYVTFPKTIPTHFEYFEPYSDYLLMLRFVMQRPH